MANFDIRKVVDRIFDIYNPEPTDVLGNQRKEELKSRAISEFHNFIDDMQMSWEDSFGKGSTNARYANVASKLVPELKEKLINGWYIDSATLYSINKISVTPNGGRVRLFENPKQVGISNINNGTLDKYSIFLLSDIRLLFRQSSKTPYERIPYWMEDGEFELTVGNRTIVTLQMSDFASDTQTVQLTDPTYIRWQETSDAVVDFPIHENAPYYEGFLKILLHGLMIR